MMIERVGVFIIGLLVLGVKLVDCVDYVIYIGIFYVGKYWQCNDGMVNVFGYWKYVWFLVEFVIEFEQVDGWVVYVCVNVQCFQVSYEFGVIDFQVIQWQYDLEYVLVGVCEVFYWQFNVE